jgi:nitroreductase
VWLGVYPKKELMASLAQLLQLPENIRPFSLVSIGYPAEEKEPSGRFDESRVHRNKW